MAITTTEDVRRRWVMPTEFPIADAVLETLIEDTEDTIESAVPGVLLRAQKGELPEGRLQKIVSRVIIRVLRNPEGIRSIQETTGPFSGSTTFGGDDPGETYLTDKDIRELSGVRQRGKAFTVTTIPGGYS